MRKLYVFVRTEYGLKSKVMGEVSKLKGVFEVIPVHGEYDLLLKAEVKSLNDLNELVYNGVRRIKGIVSTATMICAEIE